MEYRKMTIGSLFDGSGAFPLAGLLCGIKPLWSSEIAPFPLRVTTKRFPEVTPLGDINCIDGSGLAPVDIITFGSPCQDMSLAGRREGLNGNRSGLFHQAIRVASEMRKATGEKYPRYMIWENVPGAFSSNHGADFREVLQEIVNVSTDERIHVPLPSRWRNAGLILGNGFSIAWRVFDSQYWGVPQRRKRIYLVADLTGERAGEILFESEGMPWNPPACFRKREKPSGCTGECPETTVGNQCLREDASHPPIVIENHPTDSRVRISDDGICQTLTERMGTGGGNVPLLMRIRCGCEGGGKGPLIQQDRSGTLACNNDQTLFEPHFSTSKASFFTNAAEEKAQTLVATDYKDPPIVNDRRHLSYVVRRLTPVECARLQGMPDWWCDAIETGEPSDEEISWWRNVFSKWSETNGKTVKPKTDGQIRKWLRNPYSDSEAYRMWGNGITLPVAFHVLSSIVILDRTSGM